MRIQLTPLTLLTAAAMAHADTDTRRLVTTSGEATIYVEPDSAVVAVGVSTFTQKLDTTRDNNAQAGAAIVESIKALGVETADIATEDASITVVYNDQYRPGSGVQGYTADRRYMIKLKDVKLVSKVVDAATKAGANQLFGVEFKSSQMRKYRDDARRQAAVAAREKAADLATALDSAIGPVQTINETSSYWGGNRMSNSVTFGAGAGGGEAEESLTPGRIAIRSSVSVTFLIVDKAK